MDKKDIASFGYDELIEEMKQIGEKPFRAKQIYSWLHEKLADGGETDFPGRPHREISL